MPVSVWRNGQWVDKKTGEPTPKKSDGVVSVTIWPDIPDYQSPVTGDVISGRAARKEDLKKHGCIEIDPPKEPRGFKNPRFAKKYGLPLREDVAEKLRKEGSDG